MLGRLKITLPITRPGKQTRCEISATLLGEAYIPESTTTFNPRVFAEQQHQSWEAILAGTERANEQRFAQRSRARRS